MGNSELSLGQPSQQSPVLVSELKDSEQYLKETSVSSLPYIGTPPSVRIAKHHRLSDLELLHSHLILASSNRSRDCADLTRAAAIREIYSSSPGLKCIQHYQRGSRVSIGQPVVKLFSEQPPVCLHSQSSTGQPPQHLPGGPKG